ncbi:hypothetical protein ACJMK2_011202, partial [Sinanodonta woodiana]
PVVEQDIMIRSPLLLRPQGPEFQLPLPLPPPPLPSPVRIVFLPAPDLSVLPSAALFCIFLISAFSIFI